MQLTSSPRRALGLLAAGTIGLSTALLGVAGVASATPGDAVSTEAEVAAVLTVPSAPEALEVDGVGDGSVTLSFLTFYDPAVEAETTGYEISVDNGSTWGAFAVTAPYGNNERIGTVSGLTNTTAYTVVVRATSTAGPSADSNSVTATPAKPVGAPVGLTVTTAPGKVTAWERPATAPPVHESLVGDAFAVLHIPRFGAGYERVVLEGTDEEQLSQGPGHYTDTAMPGEQGNVGIAGHRVGKGSPFLELDLLQPGDPIVVETADSWFVYRVLGDPATGDVTTDPSGIPGRQIVRPEAIEVISPTPGAAESAAPSGAYLTLTTCHPRYSAQQRLIVHARLDGTGFPKAEVPNGPAALNER